MTPADRTDVRGRSQARGNNPPPPSPPAAEALAPPPPVVPHRTLAHVHARDILQAAAE